MGLLVIEGLDGSGKGTQVKRLFAALKTLGKNPLHITFPDYASPSSALVKMYLGGEFGENPEDVNPYAACSFYAVDRFASYRKHWKAALEGGRPVLADRYTTSNIVYQMTKLPKEQWDPFILWLEDLEYHKLGLPRPDKVVYLDMPTSISQGLLKARYAGDESRKDIHESNLRFLEQCRETALYAAEKLHWHIIPCAHGGSPRPIEEIAQALLRAVQEEVV